MRKAGVLALAAVGLFALDMVFIYVMGDVVVKALWTSSFVLSTATYSVAMLALFYWIVDVRGWRSWTFFFRVVGMNSIAIYMLGTVGVIPALKRFLFDGLIDWTGDPWSTAVAGAADLSTAWCLMLYLYRKRIFIRV